MLRAFFFSLALAHAALQSGAKAPDFTARGSDGKIYKLSQFKGKTVVLEWFNKDCPYVHKFYDTGTMQALQGKMHEKDVVWLTVASSAEGKEGYMSMLTAEKVRMEKKMASTALLLDNKGEVARLYSARTTPHMFVIGPDGVLVYQGAMDDQPSAGKDSLKGAKNYVEAAVAALPGKVAIASTVPYGCSVKY
jgi:peroxiredoxin